MWYDYISTLEIKILRAVAFFTRVLPVKTGINRSLIEKVNTTVLIINLILPNITHTFDVM